MSSINKNILALKNIEKGFNNFFALYHIFANIAEEDDKEAAKFALNEGYVDINDWKHDNMLTYAAFKNNFRLWKLLVQCGADHLHVGSNGRLSLHHFSFVGNLEAVKYISTLQGFDVNAVDNEDNTALDLAYQMSNYKLADFLKSLPSIERTTPHITSNEVDFDF